MLVGLLRAQAAFDFKDAHKRVENPASGTLEQEATVTYGEMIEHGQCQTPVRLLVFVLVAVCGVATQSEGFVSSLSLLSMLLPACVAASCPCVWRFAMVLMRVLLKGSCD